jgi:hypothetical protein
VLIRALEWRARRLADPAHRLQFLRRKLTERQEPKRSHEYARGAQDCLRYGLRSLVMTVTVLAGMISPDATTVLLRVPKAERRVWLVQATPQFDLYSNGLRIERQYATSTAARKYLVFAMDRPGLVVSGAAPGAASGAEWRSEPAGIVYHTTESHWAPFEQNENRELRRAGEGLLAYVSRRHSYHFVIDRFGRVFRIVRESDYANHAGNSVWADRFWIYINLNQSFLGVAFEARSKPHGLDPTVNAAQVYAGRILTDMLRTRYRIAASNCVAHAQVSVNPANFGAGFHLDWAANLPFGALGLPDNYQLPLASVRLFGFQADAARIDDATSAEDQTMEHATMLVGLEKAVAQVRADAFAQNLPVERYRDKLQERYRDAIRALRGKDAYQEYN